LHSVKHLLNRTRASNRIYEPHRLNRLHHF
jgi:hypothetical protein